MQTDQTARERQPELFEVHYRFQEQGKRLSDCLERLSTIANKLEDESECKAEKMPEPPPSPRLPGITSSLNNTVDGYKDCITQIERQLIKIEKHL